MTATHATEKDLAVVHNTFALERSFPYSPERVFSAFAFAAKKRRWYANDARHEVELFEHEFRPGGVERVRYRLGEDTPFPGVALANEGVYQDIIENRRIVWATNMTLGEKRISASLITVELLPTDAGTEMIFTHQGAFFEGSGGPEMRQEGWRGLFDELAKVLETE